MIKNHSKRLVTAGFMLALGIILPFITAHGFGIKGTIILPMHIPVLLCGFFCGPLFGFLCGLILPVLNSILTGMPAMYPMAVVMTCELCVYGFFSGGLYKLWKYKKSYSAIYLSLVPAMILGRIIYGVCAWLLLFFDTNLKNLSVISATLTGIPGIIIQLIIVPIIVMRVRKALKEKGAEEKAIEMIKSGEATCVLVKDNKIISAESPKGIYYIIDLYEKGLLNDAFVADTIVGKAAAMIFTLGKVKGCYGHTMSEEAHKWLKAHQKDITYNELTPNIKNRKGDGICPMEETVSDILDEREALLALKNKVVELSAT